MSLPRGPVRIAVMDGDAGFVRVLLKRLEGLGWQLRSITAPVSSDELVALRVHALVVDLACLESEAWDFLEQLGTTLPELGVIVCTGPSTVAQRVRGLRLGADDWLTKPCHPEELLARIEAVLRRRKRAEGRTDAEPLVVGEIEIRADQFQAFVGGRPLDLTRREFEVLRALADAQGRVLEREELYHRVWGYTMAHGDRSVDVFVRKLRQKLKNVSPSWEYIHTHFGVGYRLEPQLLDSEDQASRTSEVNELMGPSTDPGRGELSGEPFDVPPPSRESAA